MNEDNSLVTSRRSVLRKGALAAGLTVVGSAVTSGTAAAGIGDGRVGHYTLNNLHFNPDRDEKVKNHVHDASTYNNHGTNDGAEVVKDAAVGKAFAFDGTDDHVTVPDDGSLDLQDALTVAFWFRLDGKSDDNAYPRAVSKGQSTVSNGAYSVFIEDGNRDADRIGLRFIDEGGDKHDVQDRDLTPYDDGAWHHVAATYSDSDDVGRLYVDNTLEREQSIPGDVSIRTTDDDLHLGDGNGERHLNGALDEVRVYDRALSGTEVSELYEMKD